MHLKLSYDRAGPWAEKRKLLWIFYAAVLMTAEHENVVVCHPLHINFIRLKKYLLRLPG